MNDIIIVEIKSVENLLPVHEAQLLTYMSLLEKPQGLLINFYTVFRVQNIDGLSTPITF